VGRRAQECQNTPVVGEAAREDRFDVAVSGPPKRGLEQATADAPALPVVRHCNAQLDRGVGRLDQAQVANQLAAWGNRDEALLVHVVGRAEGIRCLVAEHRAGTHEPRATALDRQPVVERAQRSRV
jgi:hypothetical protein